MQIILYVMHPGVFGFAKVKIPVLYSLALCPCLYASYSRSPPRGPKPLWWIFFPSHHICSVYLLSNCSTLQHKTQNTERACFIFTYCAQPLQLQCCFQFIFIQHGTFFFSASKVFLTSSLTSVCQQSCSHSQLFSKQCMVLTLRWKRHAEIILAGWYHTASFPNGTRNLTFSWSRRCQKMTFVHSSHVVNVFELESLDKAQTLPFQTHLSIATLRGK